MNVKSIALLGIVASILLVVYFWAGHEPEQPEKQEEPQKEQELKIRRASVAGRFYPSSPEELKAVIAAYLDEAPYLNLPEIHGLVCPHAGYIYSGLTAGYSYKQLADQYDTVILIGPSHYVGFSGASIPDYAHYETPLGLVNLSEKISDLKKEAVFTTVSEAHTREHCLEVQLPFLQSVLTDFEIIPVVLGDVSPEAVAGALIPYIDEHTLVIASSDLSHYYPYEKACTLDRVCTEAVPELDFEKIRLCEACGMRAMETMMYIAEQKGWCGTLLDYRNSGDTAGGKDSVVGYMSAAFFADNNFLDRNEQDFLLHLARQTLEQYLQDGTVPEVDETGLSERLKEKRACFVTLNKYGMLRGCIGNLTPETLLYKAVIENAVNAAVRDPRFIPVTYEELSEITIEISVLTVPEEIQYEDSEDLLKKIRGKGVMIFVGAKRATYLPQVWDQLPDPEEFISSLCRKAGLQSMFWKEGTLDVYVYTAQVFGQHK